MSLSYAEFLAGKTRAHTPTGIDPKSIHKVLFPFQREVTRWALKKGKACVFAGTGLGKTLMQCEFLRHIDGYKLIVAPLAVSGQTVQEAQKLGMRVRQVWDKENVGSPGVYIVNYDRLHILEDFEWEGVVLDESSILKSHDGAFRQYITDRFARTPFKLACTATPAPNDYMELGTHAEFVGASSRLEMLATYFMHDGGDTSKWRLKRHARGDFWRWVASWACVFAHPRDLGFDEDGYDLPPLEFTDYRVEVESSIGGGLFGDDSVSATKLFKVLRESAQTRAELTASIVQREPDEPWLIWCNTDEEQNLLEKLIPKAVSVRGSDTVLNKEDRLCGFGFGKYPILITKPKIAGFGMNWQRCSRMVFCGVTYSFEQMYQAVRRCWRFGQKSPVHVYLVTCNAQESVKSSLRAKEEAFTSMAQEIAKYCTQEVRNG